MGELEPHESENISFFRVVAQFARDFTGIDAARYHESVRLQAPFCPLNVKRVEEATLEDANDEAAEIDDSILEELFDDDEEFEELIADLPDQGQDPDGSKDLFEDSDI